jgi:hypothetical protein
LHASYLYYGSAAGTAVSSIGRASLQHSHLELLAVITGSHHQLRTSNAAGPRAVTRSFNSQHG